MYTEANLLGDSVLEALLKPPFPVNSDRKRGFSEHSEIDPDKQTYSYI